MHWSSWLLRVLAYFVLLLLLRLWPTDHTCFNTCICEWELHINTRMLVCTCAVSSFMSAGLPLRPFSSKRVVVTVFLCRLDAPDNQKAHPTETLLVPTTHRWQLSNPQAGSNSRHSVKHKTWRPFTVKHQKLLETESARHMLSKWQGLLITSEEMWSLWSAKVCLLWFSVKEESESISLQLHCIP